MKGFVVDCAHCEKTVFNEALLLIVGTKKEWFCNGQCLLDWLLKKKRATGKREESPIYEEVRKAKVRRKDQVEQPPGKT